MIDSEGWISRTEALARLGVKPQTLYAYVSRGRIAARPDPQSPRRSLYAQVDIDRLRGGGDADVVPAPVADGGAVRGEALIHSSLTVVLGGRSYYRGADAVQLAGGATLEECVRRLWRAGANPFAGLKPRIGAAAGGPTRTRLLAALARRAEEDVTSQGRAPERLLADAAEALNETIDGVAGPGPRLYFHQRLARGWKVAERDADLIRRALVLAVDHAMDAAVLTTRAAADGGASMAGAALAGITTLAGSKTAADVASACAWVFEAQRDPAGASQRRMQAQGGLPGFGDAEADPRAVALLEAMDLPRGLSAVAAEGAAATGRTPDFALALALLARRLDLPRDGGVDLMLIGRLAGLLGHALDQRIDGSPIRARLRYVGLRPGAN